MQHKIKITKLDKGQIEIEGSIESAILESHRAKAIELIGRDIELPGFRKGKVPADMVEKNVSPLAIYEEMATLALNEAYPQILEKNKIDAIGRPEINITKLAPGNDLEFKIKTAVLPEIQIGDYKKVAKAEKDSLPEVTVSEEEIEKTTKEILKMRAHQKLHEDDPDSAKASPGKHSHGEIKDEDLPALDDEFVKSMGNFADVADFKTKLKENIKLEKTNMEREKRRLRIIEGVMAQSEAEIPEILVDAEMTKLLYRMQADVEQMGVKFEDYLKHLNKTEEDMKKEFRGDAEKRAKLELVLDAIAKAEKLVAEEKDIEAEVQKLMDMYKDADPERARMYVSGMIQNEKVFRFLEDLADEK